MNKSNQQPIEPEEQDAQRAAGHTEVNTEQPLAQVNETADEAHEADTANGGSTDAENNVNGEGQDSIDTEGSAETDPVQELQAEVQQLKDTLLRRTAEFENIKKRMLRERLELLESAKVEALRNFLPVNDDLQRTLLAAGGQEIPESFLQGISMVAEKFGNILSAAGVVAIAETGVPFDVNIHDALMRQAAPDSNTPSDTVLQILEPGYKAGDKVIRHAKVIVSE